MMKKIWYVAFTIVCALMATSCNNDDDDDVVVDPEWAKLNQEVIFNISGNKEYKEYKSESNAGSIYVKVLNVGEGTKPIYFNSKVKCYYTGSFVVTYESDDIDIAAGDIFDSAEPPYDNPAEFSVDGVVAGFTTALTNMHVGDRWEVWMPTQLAYGSTGRKRSNGTYSIPPYSALKFEIEVVEISED